MKIFKTEQRKLKFDKGGYWPKSIIPNLLSVKEQPKNQESEVHMGKHSLEQLNTGRNMWTQGGDLFITVFLEKTLRDRN